ncbi:HEPN domain-containing protein [Micromonospora sp. NPDC002575]|uniref:HEPN domain-containing protein n=1 Tax=Micromonospora sp. NPDC002575 TaxID=3364222 RepID=UPI0036A176D6
MVNTDDLLRFALVQGVSAFDHFVHEEVRTRMLMIQGGDLPACPGFYRFRVSLSSVGKAVSTGGAAWLEAEIREQHSYLSFQQPDKVADAFRLVTDISLWREISTQLQRQPEDVKRQLKLIVDRRNKIAHESDTDPTPPRTRYSISLTMVNNSLDFLKDVVSALDAILESTHP